ncbi:MAG: Phosphohistidine phosphatase SixA [Pelagibacterales bacterium]|nr:Phosphohistidine phosphatase SixA [Pelagibacterales bacterium]
MRNNIVPLLILLLFSFIPHSQNLFAADQWAIAKEGNKIILIRHSLAPGNGDPLGFKIRDCNTQRNLNQIGIDQSKKIGELFKNKKIPVDRVLSSQWCRCKDTARYAFGDFKEFPALNSTFQSPFDKNEPKQIEEIKKLVKSWNGKGKNLVLITHYSVIRAVTNSSPRSGEIVITDKNFSILATILTD